MYNLDLTRKVLQILENLSNINPKLFENISQEEYNNYFKQLYYRFDYEKLENKDINNRIFNDPQDFAKSVEQLVSTENKIRSLIGDLSISNTMDRFGNIIPTNTEFSLNELNVIGCATRNGYLLHSYIPLKEQPYRKYSDYEQYNQFMTNEYNNEANKIQKDRTR